MGKEIERKFLVNKEKWDQIEKPEPILYRQGYFSTKPGKSIRIRNAGTSSFLTIKSDTPELSRSEFEYEIPNQDAIELLDHFCDAELMKRRYVIAYKNKKWEVDEFLKDNTGLVLAEIELKNEQELFDLPTWVGIEVTGDKKYYNAYLVNNSFKSWKSS